MATKKERQRQLARQAYQRRIGRQAQRARRMRQVWASAIAAVLVIAVGVGTAAAAGAFSTPPKKTSAATSTSPAASTSPTVTPSPSATSAMVDGKCVYTASGTAARKVSLPSATPDTTAHYTATISTNRGTIVISLLNSKAPCTVNSFVSLADQGFYNNTPCPRLTTATNGFSILQCGDPTGTGSGGPGYEFNSENLQGAKYTAGTVAMANGGPGTNGSQFFLVYQDSSTLPANYTPFGTITSGLSVLQAIGAKGDDNSNSAGGGKPNESVQIESVTISKT